MKKRILTLALALALSLGLAAPAFAAPTFSDVPSTFWAYNEVKEAVSKGITSGYSDGTFKPGSSVTNAHFAAFLARAFYGGEYTDGSASPWYRPYTDTLSSHGVLDGTTAGSSFEASVNQPINRYDMARMMYNVLMDKGAKLPSDSALTAAKNTIKDFLGIPAHYKNAVAVCYAMGVLNGQSDGSFGGQNPMNRAQGCVVICRLLDKIENGDSAETPIAPAETPAETPTKTNPVGPNGASNGTLTNGKPITEENVIALLAELEKKYPDGTPSGSNDYYTSIQFGTGHECAGFAFRISDELFGLAENPKRRVYDLTKIRPGDTIRILKDGKTNHWTTALTAIDSDGYIQGTVDGNAGDSGVNGIVEWGHNAWMDTVSLIAQGFTFEVWTRYPEDAAYTSDAATSGFTPRPEIRCANCGFLMQAAGSADFDTNSSDSYFMFCDICREWYLCGQCASEEALARHMASCNG